MKARFESNKQKEVVNLLTKKLGKINLKQDGENYKWKNKAYAVSLSNNKLNIVLSKRSASSSLITKIKEIEKLVKSTISKE